MLSVAFSCLREIFTWWSSAHNALPSHSLSTRRSRQDRRTPAPPPRTAAPPAGRCLCPDSGTSPSPLYLRSSWFLLFTVLRPDTTDRRDHHLCLLCCNELLSEPLLPLRPSVWPVGLPSPPAGEATTKQLFRFNLLPTVLVQRIHACE